MRKHELYLRDLGFILRERALEAVSERDATAVGSHEQAFETGRVIAFNEVISMMQDQAVIFDIALSELRLEGIVPDRDLA